MVFGDRGETDKQSEHRVYKDRGVDTWSIKTGKIVTSRSDTWSIGIREIITRVGNTLYYSIGRGKIVTGLEDT